MSDFDLMSDTELLDLSDDVVAKVVEHDDLPRPQKGGGLWLNPTLNLLVFDVQLDENRTVIRGIVINGWWRYQYIGGKVCAFDTQHKWCMTQTEVTPEQARDWHRVPAPASKGLDVFNDYNEIMDRAHAMLTTQPA